MHRGAQALMLEAKNCFDEPGDPGGTVRVANVPLDGTDGAVPLQSPRLGDTLVHLEGVGQPGELDAIPDVRRRGMAFHIGNRLTRDPRHVLGIEDSLALSLRTWRREPCFPFAVVGDSVPLEDRPDVVPRRLSILHTFKHHRADRVTKVGSTRVLVEGADLAVRRPYEAFAVQVPEVGKGKSRSTSDCHVTLARTDRLGGLGYGNEARRARRVDGHRGAHEVHLERHPGRNVILLITNLTQEDAARVESILEGGPVVVVDEVPVNTTRREDARAFRCPGLWGVTGALHRLPSTLEKKTLLWIHKCRLRTANTPKRRVEVIGPVNFVCSGDPLRVTKDLGVHALVAEVVEAQLADAVHTTLQVLPEGRDIWRSGEITSHADHR
mmetsp:Transcript_12429/g.16423  ORF Transcript_12429/g.16423 Transcript_12429/m.16423 type:complete len:382 (-) Transcript_12429:34-1179(-)